MRLFIPRTRDGLRLDQRISYLSYSFCFYPFFPFNCISSLFFPWIRGLHIKVILLILAIIIEILIRLRHRTRSSIIYIFPSIFHRKSIICIIIVIVGKNANMRVIKGTMIDLFQNNVWITFCKVLREGVNIHDADWNIIEDHVSEIGKTGKIEKIWKIARNLDLSNFFTRDCRIRL